MLIFVPCTFLFFLSLNISLPYLVTRIFKCLETIQKDLKNVSTEQLSIKKRLPKLLIKEKLKKISRFGVPNGISLPVETDHKLLRLNLQLREDNSLTAAVARNIYIHTQKTYFDLFRTESSFNIFWFSNIYTKLDKLIATVN